MAAIGTMEHSLLSCFREPIPEIAEAAQHLDAAVSAHLAGDTALAEQLIRLADLPALRDWTESILGKKSPYVQLIAAQEPGIRP
jgi:hypothetical protein